jgi:hypothetical protein
MTAFVCARSGCFKIGKNRCSGCLREPYCSGECQKTDWKPHKLICKTLKKLSMDLQPYAEVDRILWEFRNSTSINNKRILEHVLSYVKFQFGDRIPQKGYRERENGECFSDWNCDICHLISIYSFLIAAITNNNTLSTIERNDLTFPYHEESLKILRPWSTCLSLGATNQTRVNVNRLDKNKINLILRMLSNTHQAMANLHMHRNLLDLSEGYCEQSLKYAKQFEGGIQVFHRLI